MKMKKCKIYKLGLFALTLGLAFTLPAMAQSSKDSGTEHGSLGELGAKLSDPTSDVWALFTEFDFFWSRGDLSDDDYKFGADMIFQPILPFKLTEDWKVLTRPTIPIVFSTPVPTGLKADGTAWAWGSAGSLGVGQLLGVSKQTVPKEVCDSYDSLADFCAAPTEGIVAIAAGGDHTLAVKTDGTVKRKGRWSARPTSGTVARPRSSFGAFPSWARARKTQA